MERLARSLWWKAPALRWGVQVRLVPGCLPHPALHSSWPQS